MTRKRGELENLIAVKANVDQVSCKLSEVERSLDKLWSCHCEYRNLLRESGDHSEVAHTDNYYSEIEMLTRVTLQQAQHWLEENRLARDPPAATHGDLVAPEDSVSQTGKESLRSSASSSASSARLKATAKKAALMARARLFEEQQSLKLKQMQMQQEQERLLLKAEIAEVSAEEKIYQLFEEQGKIPEIPEEHVHVALKPPVETVMDKDAVKGVTRSEQSHHQPDQKSVLNPLAMEWPIHNRHENVQGGTSGGMIPQEEDAHQLRREMQLLRECLGRPERSIAQSQGRPDLPPVRTSHATESDLTPLADYESRFLLLQQQMLETLQLPKTELISFDGNPLEYWMFIQAFDNSVGNAPVSDSAKLNRLLQYCKGEALKVIRCCAVKPAPIGYAKARSLLKERFGNDYKISEVWIKKVTEGPFIKSGDRYALQEIADDLTSCKETLEAMDKNKRLNQERLKQERLN